MVKGKEQQDVKRLIKGEKMEKKNAIAIITARGGSKRIPRKNIKLFCGKPIIQYTIEAALKSNMFDEVMVSTDDDEIAEISKRLGAHVPFIRSTNTANDFATTADVLEEVIEEYRKIGIEYEYICCLYPTAPFVTTEKLCFAMEKLIQNRELDAVVPVVKFSFPPQRGFVIKENEVQIIYPETFQMRSQDFVPQYHDCGQYYCMNTDSFLKTKRLVLDHTFPIITSELEVQDIDEMEDWELAELKYSKMLDRSKK